MVHWVQSWETEQKSFDFKGIVICSLLLWNDSLLYSSAKIPSADYLITCEWTRINPGSVTVSLDTVWWLSSNMARTPDPPCLDVTALSPHVLQQHMTGKICQPQTRQETENPAQQRVWNRSWPQHECKPGATQNECWRFAIAVYNKMAKRLP